MNGKVSSNISYGTINLLSNENKILAESGAYLSVEQTIFEKELWIVFSKLFLYNMTIDFQ